METQTQNQTQITQTQISETLPKPRPRLEVTSINVIEISKSTYRLVRSVVESSMRSIKCYELACSWWCEKYFALKNVKWILEPCLVQKTVNNEISKLPAVCIDYGKSSIIVLHPNLREKIFAVSIDRQEFTAEQAWITAVTSSEVPWSYPILLRYLIGTIDEIVEW